MDPYVTLNCLSDETFFIENFYTINNPFTGRLSSPLNLWPQQHNLIEKIKNKQVIIDIVTERQIGTTTILAAHALWLAMFNSFTNVGIMGQCKRHAAEYRYLIKLGYDHLPAFMKEKVTVDNATYMEFGNGSKISYMNSNPDSLRGHMYNCLIMDTFECFKPAYQTELYKYADMQYGGFEQIALL